MQKLVQPVALQLNCTVISSAKWPGDPDTCPSPGQRAPRSEQTHFPRNSGIFTAPGSFQANAGCFLSHLELKTPHYPASISPDIAVTLASPSSTPHSRPAFSPLCHGSNPASLEALSSRLTRLCLLHTLITWVLPTTMLTDRQQVLKCCLAK